jgi:hypothetical protein
MPVNHKWASLTLSREVLESLQRIARHNHRTPPGQIAYWVHTEREPDLIAEKDSPISGAQS